MTDIARLRDEGRVEALRENRDHFHVFAFVDGRRPGEGLIAESLGHSAAVRPRKEPEPEERPSKKDVKAEDRKAAKKETLKKSDREPARKADKAAARREAPKKAGGRQTARKRK